MTGAAAAARAGAAMAGTMAALVARGKLDEGVRGAIVARIGVIDAALGDNVGVLADCGLVIEAIVEDLAAKQALFARLGSVVAPDAIIASNTSALAIAALAGGWIFLRNPALATMVAAAFTEKSHGSRRRR